VLQLPVPSAEILQRGSEALRTITRKFALPYSESS
jgi:hypothetical protein